MVKEKSGIIIEPDTIVQPPKLERQQAKQKSRTANLIWIFILLIIAMASAGGYVFLNKNPNHPIKQKLEQLLPENTSIWLHKIEQLFPINS